MELDYIEEAHRVILLNNSTGADDVSTGYTFVENGNKTVTVSGVLGTAVVFLEIKGAGGWAPIGGGEFTVIESKTLVRVPKGRVIRARVAGTATGVYVEITK